MLHRMNWHPPEKLRMAEWKVFGHMASKSLGPGVASRQQTQEE